MSNFNFTLSKSQVNTVVYLSNNNIHFTTLNVLLFKEAAPMVEVEGHGRCLSIEDAHEIKQDQSYLMVYTYHVKGFTLGRSDFH